MIDVALEGEREVMARLEGLPSTLRACLSGASEESSLVLQRRALQERLSGAVSVLRGNGRTSSIEPLLPEKRDGVAANLRSDLNFAGFQEFRELKLRTLRPRHARALAFEHGGRTCFRRRTSRPPLPQGSSLRVMVRQLEPELREKVAVAVTEALKS